MRLIDADEFMRFTHEQLNLDETFDADDIWQMIAEQPTIEAQPVVHGEWVEGCIGGWVCSVCHEENCYAYNDNLKRFTDSFCPTCGADMRKKV